MNEVVSIVNTQPRLLHLPSSVRREEDQHGIKVIPNYDGKVIPPSAPKIKGGAAIPTKIDKSYWEEAKKNAQVKTWIKLGWLKVSGTGDAGEFTDSLMKFNAKTAVTLVESEKNPALLEEWKQSEERPDVAASISARLAELTPKKK